MNTKFIKQAFVEGYKTGISSSGLDDLGFQKSSGVTSYAINKGRNALASLLIGASRARNAVSPKLRRYVQLLRGGDKSVVGRFKRWQSAARRGLYHNAISNPELAEEYRDILNILHDVGYGANSVGASKFVRIPSGSGRYIDVGDVYDLRKELAKVIKTRALTAGGAAGVAGSAGGGAYLLLRKEEGEG